MRPEIKPISLNLIRLDQENVRFGNDVAESEREAIELLMADPEDARKILRLAEHIAENGLDPTELQLLTPDGDGRYIVLEGNRRLTALKLLQKPDLCPVPKLAKSFIELNQQLGDALPEDIDCSIVPTREAGDIWIELKHTGENRGVGRVGWDSDIRDERRARQTGVESIGRQIRNLVKNEASIFSDDIRSGVHHIPVTTLTRLFSSRPAQDAFQLHVIGKKLIPMVELNCIAPSVEFAISLFVESGYNVNDIKSADDRCRFIAQIPEELLALSLSTKDRASGQNENGSGQSAEVNPSSNTNQFSANNPQEPDQSNGGAPGKDSSGQFGSGQNQAKTRARPSSKNRKYLFPWSLNITNSRINEIYRDLRNVLLVEKCPNSVAICFRVLIEVSCDNYTKRFENLSNKVLKVDNGQNLKERDKLSHKVSAVATHLFNEDKISNHEMKSIRKRATSNDTIGSIDHFNQFVHGSASSPIASELKDIAEEYKPFLEAIWK